MKERFILKFHDSESRVREIGRDGEREKEGEEGRGTTLLVRIRIS